MAPLLPDHDQPPHRRPALSGPPRRPESRSWPARALLAALVAVLVALPFFAGAPAHSRTRPFPNAPEIDVAKLTSRLLVESLSSRAAYKRLQFLTDRIGHRLSGSPQSEQAIYWALE